jgi:hypothetical protein
MAAGLQAGTEHAAGYTTLALVSLNAISMLGLQRVLGALKASGQSMLTRVPTLA